MRIAIFCFGEWFGITLFTSAYPKHMTSWQHPNADPPGKRLRNVAPQIKAGQCGSLATGIDRRAPRQRTGLRSKPKRAGAFCQIQGLDAVRISDQPQLSFDAI